MKLLAFKKLANHWYPEISHDYLDDIRLSEKIEKFLSIIDKNNNEYVTITMYEQDCYIEDSTLQFGDDSLCRYFTTNDDFDMNIWINDHKFVISSDLYSILEQIYEFKFHENIYRIEVI